jgi:hypothetical protein
MGAQHPVSHNRPKGSRHGGREGGRERGRKGATYHHGFRPESPFQTAACPVLVDPDERASDAGKKHGGTHALSQLLEGLEIPVG